MLLLQLDDWVLCRLYNKKGRMEKHYPIDRKVMELPEMEEQKPDIKNSAQNMTMYPQQSPMNDLLHMDTSDSLPRLHTDSSCSEHVLSSPEIACDKEVQSEAKWNELENAFDDFQFNYLDSFQDNNPFGSQVQYQMEQLSPLQDMFMLLQKPF